MFGCVLMFQIFTLFVIGSKSCEDEADDDIWDREDMNDIYDDTASNDANFNPGFNLRRFRQDQLNLHNHYRRLHGVPMMRLHNRLNAQAQKYAEKLAADNQGMVHCDLPRCDRYKAGENLATAWGGINAEINATKSWYDEIWDYDFCSASQRSGHESKQIGHFTQVVWRLSKKLGIGYARTKDRKRVFIVGRYLKHGNVKGKFAENVLKPSYLLRTYQNNCKRINGRFSQWSQPGSCTQSCGGGIQLRTRTCTNPKPSYNGRDCNGETKKLAIRKWCNKDACKDNLKHRERQCKSRGFQKSGYLAKAPCVLYCLNGAKYMPQGAVEDGTHCKDDTGVCVTGKCVRMPKFVIKIPQGGIKGRYTKVPDKNFWKNRLVTIPNGAVNAYIINYNYNNAAIMVGWTKGMRMGVDFGEGDWMKKIVEYRGSYSQTVNVQGVTMEYKRTRSKSTIKIKGPVQAKSGYKIQLFVKGDRRANISWSYSGSTTAK